MMKIGICDVNSVETAKTIYLLSSYSKNNGVDEEKVTYISYNFDSVMLDLYDQKFDCDIFITELSFPNGKNGVKLAKRINDVVPSCNIIFYTGRIPNELDIYDANHVNCMIKGRHDARLVTFVAGLLDKIGKDSRKRFIKIRYDRNVYILDCRVIMYIKLENRVTKYYTTKKSDTEDGVFYEYRPLSEIMEDLPDNFVRCHAAAIVNMDYVQSYNHQIITMIDDKKIRIGRRYGEAM